MTEVTGNLWTYKHEKEVVRCITTNGFVKTGDIAVMGRGCALEAALRFPPVRRDLAKWLRKAGNVPGWFRYGGTTLLTFPTKHNWWEPADPELIAVSAAALDQIARSRQQCVFLLPRPGCGNGGLKWPDIKPLLESLPDNVLVISPGATIARQVAWK